MIAFRRKAMPDPIRSVSPCAALLFVLVAPLLSGCGGAATAENKGFDHPPPPPGFLRVGEVTLDAEGSAAAAATAAASADPAAPQPAPTSAATDSGTESRPPNEKTTEPSKPVMTAAAGGSSQRYPSDEKRVQGAVVDSSSGLSEADVRSTIVQQQAAFQACYEIGVQSSSGSFSGVVTLRAAIGPTGTVASVDVVSSSTKNVRVDGCAADAVRRILFPAKGGGAVVAIPIEFGR